MSPDALTFPLVVVLIHVQASPRWRVRLHGASHTRLVRCICELMFSENRYDLIRVICASASNFSGRSCLLFLRVSMSTRRSARPHATGSWRTLHPKYDSFHMSSVLCLLSSKLLLCVSVSLSAIFSDCCSRLQARAGPLCWTRHSAVVPCASWYLSY